MKRVIKLTKSPRDDRATLIKPGAYTKTSPLSPIQVENDRMGYHCSPIRFIRLLGVLYGEEARVFCGKWPTRERSAA